MSDIDGMKKICIEKVSKTCSRELVESIVRHEDLKPRWYRCGDEPFLTCGVGHKHVHGDWVYAYYDERGFVCNGAPVEPRIGDVVGLDGIINYLIQDIEKASRGAHEILNGSKFGNNAETVFNVITEMVFQLGVNGVRKFRKMLIALKSRNFVEASIEMMASEWHKQTCNRCEELSKKIYGLEKNPKMSWKSAIDEAKRRVG